MPMLRRQKIQTKIAIVLSSLVGVVALSGVVSFRMAADLSHVSDLREQAYALMLADKDALAAVVDQNSHLRGLVMTGDPGNAKDMTGDQTRFEARLADARTFSAIRPEVAAQIEAVAEAEAAWKKQIVDVVTPLASAVATRDQAGALLATEQNRRMVGDIRKASARLLETAQNAVAEAGATYNSTLTAVRFVSFGTTALVGLLATGIIWVLSGLIARPISRVTEVMHRLASGDLQVTVEGSDGRDEVGQMSRAVQVFKDAALEKKRLEQDTDAARRAMETERAATEADRAAMAKQQAEVVQALAAALARLSSGDLMSRLERAFAPEYEALRADFNLAVENLQTAIKDVAGNAEAIRTSTAEISSASQDMSRRTEHQAASLEETAAALDQITATVKKTAEGTSHARTVVSAARADAEESGGVVRQAVAAMKDIEASSQRVGQIIGVIDEIAFQTNLLALNAGVEAARAGDAGRGFAVVASEVRGLAQRSAEAAKEIKALILASKQQVDGGVDLVARTGESLGRIVAQVAEISAIVNDTASSAQEQATALQEVNSAVNNMDQVTQQNAAMVEQSTAASHTLHAQAANLTTLVGRFQIGAEARHRPVVALKPVGRGGAAPRHEEQGWADF